jgi:hypothetical protein
MGTQASADSVYYINGDTTQFKILPFQISVLIEQNRIQDLLVALENSPMAVQVREFEMSKPSTRVVKPVKGQNMNFNQYAGGAQFASGYRSGMSGSGYPGAGGGMPGSGYPGAGGGMSGSGYPGAGGGMPPQRSGIDKRGVDRAKQRKAEELAVKSSGATQTIHDPYFNIVEVTIYGQARFYNPPPAAPAPEPSVAESAPPAASPEGTPPATEAPKAEGEAPKAEAPKAEGEAPKAEAPKEAAPAPMPNGEAPKAESGGTPPK